MDGSFYASLACGKRWIAAGLPGVIISNLVTWVWTGSAYVVPAVKAKPAVHAVVMPRAVERGRIGPTNGLRQQGRSRWIWPYRQRRLIAPSETALRIS